MYVKNILSFTIISPYLSIIIMNRRENIKTDLHDLKMKYTDANQKNKSASAN